MTLETSPEGYVALSLHPQLLAIAQTPLVALDTVEKRDKDLAHRELTRGRNVQKAESFNEQVDAVGLELLFRERVARAELARQVFHCPADSGQRDAMLAANRRQSCASIMFTKDSRGGSSAATLMSGCDLRWPAAVPYAWPKIHMRSVDCGMRR